MNHDAAPPVVHADDDDVALMSAFAAGDVQAFEWLYRRHHAALYRFVRRLLGRDAAV
jgi:DNA-directed RNA polymerase specialized sigma24 family protein